MQDDNNLETKALIMITSAHSLGHIPFIKDIMSQTIKE
jgi:hypothetical protein